MYPEFEQDVREMNAAYDLPVGTSPKLPGNPLERLWQFKDILQKELNEIEDIIEKAHLLLFPETKDVELDVLVDLSDLLGDLIVYCTSEAARYGIPLRDVLRAIMKSNKTKLDVDGNPIKDENDKFLKGPNFVPPEPEIKEILSYYIDLQKNYPNVVGIGYSTISNETKFIQNLNVVCNFYGFYAKNQLFTETPRERHFNFEALKRLIENIEKEGKKLQEIAENSAKYVDGSKKSIEEHSLSIHIETLVTSLDIAFNGMLECSVNGIDLEDILIYWVDRLKELNILVAQDKICLNEFTRLAASENIFREYILSKKLTKDVDSNLKDS